jgi:hypothetical protein
MSNEFLPKDYIMPSKSFFNNTTTNDYSSMLNPVNGNGMGLNPDIINTLKKVQSLYTSNLSKLNYNLIPSNYDELLHLYNTINISYKQASSPSLKLLLKITGEGLIGSMNAVGLFKAKEGLNQEIAFLNSRIEQLLNPVETETISTTTGNLTLTKTFTLAPLFSIYITLYGMPERGVGFDPDKISNLLIILEKYEIDPYN